ncbi:MAG: hypothetical protein VKN60_10785 [Cyanobacteriota bacterium]|nr:hypothetical protein [Cyanobacteriota bacterium]
MTTINSSIPLESLIQAFQSLNWDEQKELLEILEDKIFETEEAWENSAEILSEVQEAKQAYQEGDYQTLEEFLAN